MKNINLVGPVLIGDAELEKKSDLSVHDTKRKMAARKTVFGKGRPTIIDRVKEHNLELQERMHYENEDLNQIAERLYSGYYTHFAP
jgi:hypothetical protein